MKNIIYPVRPESSPKVAPVKKKDIHESLQEANESAEKLNVRMTELASRFATMQKMGVTTRLDSQSMKQLDTVITQTNAMPKEVEKAVNKAMGRVVKQMDERMDGMIKFCISATIVINILWVMMFFMQK